MGKITQKDIAKETGYSVSTVSRVLSGSAKISTKTRNEVLKSAKRNKYQPVQSSGRTSPTKTLDILLLASGFHEGEFYVSYFNGLNQAANSANIRLFLNSPKSVTDSITDLLEEIRTDHYDGAILFMPELKTRHYLKIREAVPVHFALISNALIENPVVSTITFDSYSGGHLAALHFDEKGHEQLGIIKGPVERAESRFRYNGFTDYINQHPRMKLGWNYQGNFTFDSGHAAFEAFQKLTHKPRAIFASNDDMCNGFMEAAISHGVSFPDDIAIIGYDNLPLCRHNRPTISSINTDYKQLGHATMKLMREKLRSSGNESNLLRLVPVSVAQRDST